MAATKPNPMHLALWSVTGALIAASAFVLTFIPIPHVVPSHPGILAMNWANRVRWMVVFLPLVGGLLVWYLANRRFARGFADGIWSEAELASVRQMLESSAWMWIGIAIIAAATLVIGFDSKASNGTFLYFLTFPLNAVASLRRLLSPPTKREGLIDWHNAKPLRSDHWGEVRHEERLPS